MITIIFLKILTGFISVISSVLPGWTVWPQQFLDGLNYLFSNLATFNFLFPVSDIFSILLFFINFEVLYFTSKIIMKTFNFFRGTGSGLDL